MQRLAQAAIQLGIIWAISTGIVWASVRLVGRRLKVADAASIAFVGSLLSVAVGILFVWVAQLFSVFIIWTALIWFLCRLSLWRAALSSAVMQVLALIVFWIIS